MNYLRQKAVEASNALARMRRQRNAMYGYDTEQARIDSAPVGSVGAPGGVMPNQNVAQGRDPTQDLLAMSGMVPGLGDITGPIADARMFATQPESRTLGNFGLAALGALPVVPSLAAGAYGVGKLVKGSDYADTTADALRMATGAGGAQMAPGNGLVDMTVYHGSPYKFDAFDMSKIGTGEGAQAYGHGLYFAENPEVAGQYASMFAKPGPDRKALMRLRDAAPEGSAEWQHYDGLMQEGISNLYDVDIPDEAIANMLDWDAPLSEQPESVRKALTAIAQEDSAILDKFKELGPKTTADQAYTALVEYAVRQKKYEGMRAGMAEDAARPSLEYGQAWASEKLRAAGIPGLKYYDGGSRSAGNGTRNIVVFDDKLPKILKRNGEPVNALAK